MERIEIEDDIPDEAEDAAESEPDVGIQDQAEVEFDEETPTAEENLRYFGADFDVEGLVRRLNIGDIGVPSFDPAPHEKTEYAGFQRKFIWTKRQKDRFIESLLLGYPVPGIFLVERPGRKYLVLDGQQRLRTLQEFTSGFYGEAPKERVFYLQYVGPMFRRLRYADLKPADARVLNNTFIQATVVVPKLPDQSKRSVYQLFERINSGGTNLQPQEIRVALYAGPRIDLIRELNYDANWRKLFGEPHSRLRDNELILRYMALRKVTENLRRLDWDWEGLRSASTKDEQLLAYRSPMSTFLNKYLDLYSEDVQMDGMEVGAFRRTCAALARQESQVLRTDGSAQLNAAHTEALLVGLSLSRSIVEGNIPSDADVKRAYDLLMSDDEYLACIGESTSHAASVGQRLKISSRIFADV